jgi:hypothetical protein
MTKALRCSLFLVPFLFSGVLRGRVTASLTLYPAKVIAGTPASLSLEVVNSEDAVTDLPNYAALRVSPSLGDPFLAGKDVSGRVALIPLPDASKLNPNGSRKMAFVARSLWDSAPWFRDPRLNAPGTYRLQLLLIDGATADALNNSAASQAEAMLPVRVVSTEAILTISEPEGEDALLWERLNEISKTRGCEPGIWSPDCAGLGDKVGFAKEVVEKHPASHYAPYVLSYYFTDTREGGSLEAAERVVSRNPAAPNREYMQLLLARSAAKLAETSMHSLPPNKAEALKATEMARSLYAAITRQAVDEEILSLARNEAAALLTPQQISRQRADDDPTP